MTIWERISAFIEDPRGNDRVVFKPRV